MDPTTQTLLQAVAALARHAQARPTDTGGLRGLRRERAAAEAAWLAAGCPDLVDDKEAPMAPAAAHPATSTRRTSAGPDRHRPMLIVVDVIRLTERGALLDDGRTRAWVPRSFVIKPGTNEFADLVVGDMTEVQIPFWLADEKGLEA